MVSYWITHWQRLLLEILDKNGLHLSKFTYDNQRATEFGANLNSHCWAASDEEEYLMCKFKPAKLCTIQVTSWITVLNTLVADDVANTPPVQTGD